MYIDDFADLSPARSKPGSLLHYLQGHVLALQMQESESNSERTISVFTNWHTAAILMKQPEKTPDMMAYVFMTANNARRYRRLSLLAYDQSFCQLMVDTRDNA